MLVVITLVDSLTEGVSHLAVAYGFNDTFKWIVSYATQVIYYLTHLGMLPVFTFYIIVICGVRHRLNTFTRFGLKLPIYVLELFLLTNPFPINK